MLTFWLHYSPGVITFNRTLLVSVEITRHSHSIIAYSLHLDMGAILRAYPVRGEMRIQCHANRDVVWNTTYVLITGSCLLSL